MEPMKLIGKLICTVTILGSTIVATSIPSLSFASTPEDSSAASSATAVTQPSHDKREHGDVQAAADHHGTGRHEIARHETARQADEHNVSGHGSNNDGGHHEASIGDLFWFWINFTVFASILFSLIKKPFQQFWASRAEAISTAINKGQRDVEEASEKLRHAHEKHQKINQDIEALAQSVIRDANVEVATMKAATAKQAERILQQAAVTAKSEHEQATRKLRQQIIEEAFVQAEDTLSKAAKQSQNDESDKARRKAVTEHIGALR
jgi:F0F1-type ATP synthase membrane subunit b/b'